MKRAWNKRAEKRPVCKEVQDEGVRWLMLLRAACLGSMSAAVSRNSLIHSFMEKFHLKREHSMFYAL